MLLRSSSPGVGSHLASVLPHEKVFLEYLPSADQYYKSFMHRDIVNFVVVTRSVSSSLHTHTGKQTRP